MHGERNYPTLKECSDRDVGLPDGTGDDAYLDALQQHLPVAFGDSRPELVFYLAGGYAATPARTAQLHANTFIEAAGVASRRSPRLPPARLSGGMPA